MRLRREREDRALQVATHYVDTKSTIRETAQELGLSRGCVHKDLRERILEVNYDLARRVEAQIELNKMERVYRAAAATKRYWKARE